MEHMVEVKRRWTEDEDDEDEDDGCYQYWASCSCGWKSFGIRDLYVEQSAILEAVAIGNLHLESVKVSNLPPRPPPTGGAH